MHTCINTICENPKISNVIIANMTFSKINSLSFILFKLEVKK